MVNPQEWLEKYYPDKETSRIYINQQLEGILDCSEYKWLEYIFISTSVDSSKLEIKGGSYWDGETKITPCIPAQEYINQEYPINGTCQIKEVYPNNFGKTREEIKELDISGKGLEGALDLSDFKNLETLQCCNNCLTNLNINNCKNLKKIYCQDNQLTNLNLSSLAELKKLLCSNNFLTQIIYPPNPEKITELIIYNNNINPSDLSIFSKFRNLDDLNIGNTDKNKINQNIYNHFQGSLEPLKDLKKLERLDISNTDISGSLEYLNNLNNLRGLNISNTDINSGWEYLPDSLTTFHYDTDLRPNCKLALAKAELEKEIWADIHKDFISYNKLLRKDWLEAGFSKEQTKEFLEEWRQLEIEYHKGAFINWFLNFKKLDLNWALENEEEFKQWRDNYVYFGTCEECQQPNVSGGSDGLFGKSRWGWCHSCNAKHFQEEFNNWTSGNFQIDNFIQKCQLEATSNWNLLEWIPYEKFTNIEPIAQGGFGKVEKAEWEEGSVGRWDNKNKQWKRGGHDRVIALKTLSNSQNLNQEFLQELTLYKMFRSSVSQMVPCYGISRDLAGNYIMVMEYMKEGNLREYLKRNYRELDLLNKLNLLKQISQGLKDIHRKKLVHRDFHSGNIIVGGLLGSCHITDLGLSKPVDETDDSQVYGIVPYVAPEVLQGQSYTQKADIYSLGMIMYEIITGLPPFAEQAHDLDLSLRICRGVRPQFPPQLKYPQLLIDLIKQCWDNEPNNRPSAREVSGIMGEWFGEYNDLKKDTQFYHQYEEVENYNKTLPNEIKYPTYQSPEVWHSKPINTKQITQLLQASKDLELNIQEEPEQAQIQIPPK